MIAFWAARLGWFLAAWSLLVGRPVGVAAGLIMIVTHLLLGPVEIEVEPDPKENP